MLNHYTSGSGWTRVRDHYALRKLNKPNKRFSRYETNYTSYFNYVGTGNAFLATPLEWTGMYAGLPAALIPLIPFLQCSMPFEQYNGDLKYGANSKLFIGLQTHRAIEVGYERTLVQEEIIHMRQNSMNTGLWGQNPFSFLADAVGIALAGQRINGVGMKNGMTNQGFLKPTGRAGPEAVQQAQSAWKTATSGMNNVGNTPVMPGGYDFIKTTLTPAEFELGMIRDRQNADIARALHVPGSLVGLTDGLASNYPAELNNYQNRCLTPIATPYEELHHDKFFPGDDANDWELKLDFDFLGRADELSRTNTYAKQIQLGLRKVNDIIDLERWPRNPDGDIYMQALNTGTFGENGSDQQAGDLSSAKEGNK
jgi:HK97 family phage portal protein